MDEQTSNQELLAAWQSGEEQAAALLVNRYLVRLTALVRARLSRRLARRIDPEDVVLSAWRSFFVAAASGRAGSGDNDDLWPLLATITRRKLSRQAARQRAGRRAVDREEPDPRSALAELAAEEPTAESAIAVSEEVESILAQLEGLEREVFLRRVRGELTSQIAEELQISERTVRRASERIRSIIEARDSNDAARATEVDHPKESISTTGGPDAATRGQERRRTLPQAANAAPLPAPTIAIEQLVLERMIGEGGFGKVYEAQLLDTNEAVAVKFLRKRLWSDRRAVATLIREARLLSDLNEPGIVACRGWGRTSYGAVFLVMERIAGNDLQTWTKRERPPLPEIVQAVSEAAKATAAAHARGVLHCDLKPSNVLRRSDGRIVLTDFGFARRTADPANDLPAGGTAGFLAPEQVSDAFGTIGPRTDVYGLGALLYALLTGQPPMTGRDTPEVLARVLSAEPPAPPSQHRSDIPPTLEAIVMQCLEKEPAARPATAAEVAVALRAISRKSSA